MVDRRKFIGSMGSGILTLSAGTSLSFVNVQEKKPFILNELPDLYKEEYSKIKIGMCQVYTEEWAVEANIKRTLEAIDLAAIQGAEIAVTPECVFHGYSMDPSGGKSEAFRKSLYDIAESPDGDHLQLFKNKAKDKGIHILVGFVERGEGNLIHNSAALISPDGSFVYIYRKVHCRHFENINHWGYFTPGSNFYSSELKLKEGKYNVGSSPVGPHRQHRLHAGHERDGELRAHADEAAVADGHNAAHPYQLRKRRDPRRTSHECLAADRSGQDQAGGGPHLPARRSPEGP